MKSIVFTSLFLSTLSISTTLAFHSMGFHSPLPSRFRFRPSRTTTILHQKSAKDSASASGSPAMDWGRAKHCAEHFGSCEVEEVEELYKHAHRERIQHHLFGGGDLLHDTQEDIEHRVIEEELELQLHLLQKEQHEAEQQMVKLFPDEMITELPHLREPATTEVHPIPVSERILHEAEHQLAIQETSLGEDTLETLTMCAVVALMVLVPQFLN